MSYREEVQARSSVVGGVVEAVGVREEVKEAGQGRTWVSIGTFVQDILCRVKRPQEVFSSLHL